MKHTKRALTPGAVTPRLVLQLEQIRLISGGDDGLVEAPPATHGSTASSCQSTKFNCCK